MDSTIYVDFNVILAWLWNACDICLTWLQTHGITTTFNGHTGSLSFFTIIIGGTYIWICVTYLPILYELASDTYHPLSDDIDDD